MSKLTKFFKHPVMFFEDAQKNKKLKKGKPKIFVVGFSTWKTYLRMYFSEYDLIFLPKDIKKSQFNSQYRKQIVSLKDSCQVFIWGFKAPEYILEFLREEKIPTKFVEDGFVRSVQLGATKAPPMSLCLDSKTPYFDATRPSELEDLLNSFDFTSKPELIDQAKEGINLLLETGVSKYNNSEKVSIEKFYGPKTKKRILVLGQVEDDASIQYGCEKKLTNNDVVRLAAEENPGAQIIYKPHPDVMNGHRPYQSNPADVENIALVLKKDVPLSNAFETVDHVYTMTSLGGFEALLRGIKVTALGSPFYAGWGLTDDRQANERRKRQLTIEQVFAIAYLVYPKYFEPENGRSIKFEEVVATIKKLLKTEGAVYSLPPQTKETRFDGATIAFYINDWKRPILQSWFPEKNFIFVPIKTTDQQLKSNWLPKIIAAQGIEIFVWGMNLSPLIKEIDVPTTYIEDGFIRSVGLGALHTPPLSLNFDRQTPYFNSGEPSDLEDLLNSYDFSSEPNLLNRATNLIDKLLTTKISKYNHSHSIDIHSIYGPKNKKRILVIGQVEDDASILYGSSKRYTNNDLVYIAALENPQAQILYKPHPDVLNKKREMFSNPDEVKHICQVIEQDVPLADSFETIDHVYTITSLAGFEALLRKIPVTVMGCPFYSGWGLTDDRQPNPRRTRKLTLEQLFAVSYILYPSYYNPYLKTKIDIEDAIDLLLKMKDVLNEDAGKVKKESFDLSLNVLGSESQVSTKVAGLTDPKCLITYAKYLVAIQSYADALLAVEKAIDYNGGAECYLEKASILQKLGSFDEKIDACFYKAIGLSDGEEKNTSVYKYFNYKWESQPLSDVVINSLKYYIVSAQSIYGNSKSIGKLKLLLAAFLVETGQVTTALKFRDEAKRFKATDQNFMFLRYRAKMRGDAKAMTSYELDKFEKLLSFRGSFKSIVLKAQGDVCIVGNSPALIGRKLGREIDKHKVVVRFNSYNTDYPYCEDYGVKTNVWVRMPFHPYVKNEVEENHDLIMFTGSNRYHRNYTEWHSVFELLNKGVPVEFIDPFLFYELQSKLKSPPTAGLMLCYMLYKIIGPLKSENFYGFSFADNSDVCSYHYSDNNAKASRRHDWDAEASVFKTLLANDDKLESSSLILENYANRKAIEDREGESLKLDPIVDEGGGTL